MPNEDINIVARLASEGWISLNQFAKLVGISYPTALKLKSNNQIAVIKVGGVHRVYANEARRFLEHGNLPKTPQ